MDNDESINSNLGGIKSSYVSPNQFVTAPTSANSAALIFGRRGANAVLAIGGFNANTPFCNMIQGQAAWVTVTYNNGLIISSADAYTYLRVIWLG